MANLKSKISYYLDVQHAFDAWYGDGGGPDENMVMKLSFTKNVESVRFWYVMNLFTYTRLLAAVIFHFAKYVFTRRH